MAGGGDDAPRPADHDETAKTSWPELVSRREIKAALAILKERPDVRIESYDFGRQTAPSEFDPKRVVLYSDDSLVVVATPKIG
ncbi:hypothetical protein BRADI_2g19344v3 [Brachypodium distachyon]|uniref:Subtilisin inhibitor 1 n=1 Tax=Brachypodium distachyon TaxID=15368 RepID=A0A0Q3QVC5_BRADI|nr:hypothetical protein BRADI_2g19344v3 [Brachypodium distachyon]